MSQVVRVVAGPPPAPPALELPELPRRLGLDLDELVAAARLAGDVPLPVRLDAAAGQRLTDRLAGGAADDARARLTRTLARAADDGPDGAVAALAARGLVADGVLDPGVTAALQVLAGGAGMLQVDLSQVRRHGVVGLRSWLGVQGRLVAQLSTSGGERYELSWYDVGLWHSQMARVATVGPPAGQVPVEEVPDVPPLGLPSFVSLPTELLLGSRKAVAEGRRDLVAALAADQAGHVRAGEHGAVSTPEPDRVEALLLTLATAARGRLRVLARRRDREQAPSVTSWLLFDDGWRELRPGPGATTRLLRREPRDLGVLLEPFAADVAAEVAR